MFRHGGGSWHLWAICVLGVCCQSACCKVCERGLFKWKKRGRIRVRGMMKGIVLRWEAGDDYPCAPCAELEGAL